MRKSLWSPDEDEKLRRYVATHGCGNWSDVAKHTGLRRCGKSCRLRWINYLRPDLKRGPFSAQEVRLVVNLHNTLGNSWSKIATQLPGRTDNDVKNFWHSYTRSQRLQQQQRQQQLNNGHADSEVKKESSHDDIEKKESSHDHEQLVSSPTHTSGNIHKIPATKNIHTSPQIHLSICKPTYPYTTTLHAALSHTNFLINFNDPSHISHNSDTQLLFSSQEPHISINPLINTDLKPLMITHKDYTHAEAALYKDLQPHVFSDQSCCSKGSVISFQHFPLSQEASDDHNYSMSALSSSYSEISTLEMKNASTLDHGRSMVISTTPSNSNYPSLVHGDRPAGSIYAAKSSLPASHTENDQAGTADIKPPGGLAPEGLQSVIWSFLNREATTDDPAVTAASVADHYKAQYHNHNHHLQQQYMPNITPPVSLDHPPHQLAPDQYTIEALSTSAALQYLQAQLADCFS